MDYLIHHPGFQDHAQERDLGRTIDTTVIEDDPRGTGRMTDEQCVTLLLKAIQSNQVQLIPRTGNSGAYQQLITHLGTRAKEMENV